MLPMALLRSLMLATLLAIVPSLSGIQAAPSVPGLGGPSAAEAETPKDSQPSLDERAQRLAEQAETAQQRLADLKSRERAPDSPA